MSSQDYRSLPKVLVVGAAPFGTSTGTGITLTNLFNGWPAEKLAQIHTMDTARAYDVCSQYYLYSPKNAPLDYSVRRLVGGVAQSKVKGASAIAAVGTSGGSEPASAGVHRQMRAIADLSPLLVPIELRVWVQNFRPDVVYSLLGSVRIMRLALRVARICNAPIAPHFMDDWPRTLYASGELRGYARKAVMSTLDRVMASAPQGFCISGAMASEYQKQFCTPFSEFANCVDECDFAVAEAVDGVLRSKDVVRFVYAGGLHLGRAGQLRDIGLAADSYRTSESRIEVQIYAPESDLRSNAGVFDGVRSVRLMRSLRKEEVAGVLSQADVLLHVESFDESVQQYTRLSLSTKIPQYMASGRPILGYGPGGLASMQHIRDAGAGIVVGGFEGDELAVRIAQLAGNVAMRDRLGAAGYRFARTHHSRNVVAQRFGEALTSVAQEQPRR